MDEVASPMLDLYKSIRLTIERQEGGSAMGTINRLRAYVIILSSDMIVNIMREIDPSLTNDGVYGKNGEKALGYLTNYDYASDHKAQTNLLGFDIILSSSTVVAPLENFTAEFKTQTKRLRTPSSFFPGAQSNGQWVTQ